MVEAYHPAALTWLCLRSLSDKTCLSKATMPLYFPNFDEDQLGFSLAKIRIFADPSEFADSLDLSTHTQILVRVNTFHTSNRNPFYKTNSDQKTDNKLSIP